MQENTVFPFILSFSLNVVQKTYEKLQVSNVFGNHNGYSTRRANPTFGISKTGIHSSLFSRIKQYYKSKPKWRMALSNLSRFQPTLRVWSCWLLPIQRPSSIRMWLLVMFGYSEAKAIWKANSKMFIIVTAASVNHANSSIDDNPSSGFS